MFTCILCFEQRPDTEKADDKIYRHGRVYGFYCKKCADSRMEWVRELINKIKKQSGYATGSKDSKST